MATLDKEIEEGGILANDSAEAAVEKLKRRRRLNSLTFWAGRATAAASEVVFQANMASA